MSNLKALMERVPQVGRITWIGLRPARRQALQAVDHVMVNATEGLIGDHYQGRSGNRHLTLIQEEHLQVVAQLLGQDDIDPGLLRRNMVVAGINLHALQGKQFHIGTIQVEATGPCHPCSRMEENLGEGGYQAMRGHGGLCVRILGEGTIKLGDEVRMP